MGKKFLIISLIFASGAIGFTALADEGDNQPPTEVTGLTLTPYDSAVLLKWTEANDNVAVTGYKLFWGPTHPQKEGESFENELMIEAKNTHLIENLTNGEEYFFSAVALDEAGNESLYWAQPSMQSETPSADAGMAPSEDENGQPAEDNEAPTVTGAEAMYVNKVKVEFSEAVMLPEEDAEDAFLIEDDATLEVVEVLSVEMDEEDEEGKTVILEVADLTVDGEYTLTVTIDVTDLSQNPIISGTSDTAAFVGTDLIEEVEEVVELMIENIEVVNNTTIAVSFNAPLTLSIDPATNFEIIAADDPAVSLEFLGINLGENSARVADALAIITTSEQENREYTMMVRGMPGIETELLVDFTGLAAEETPDEPEQPDVILPPADAASFLATKLKEAEKQIVKLSWKFANAINEAAVMQTLYRSQDQGSNYSVEANLDPDVTEYELQNLEAGEYWFKLTQTDADGVESEGIITKVSLVATGPGMLALIFASAGFGAIANRRRKRK
jgi:hypothetical protein